MENLLPFLRKAQCPRCGSTNVIKSGHRLNVSRGKMQKVQMFTCKNCGKDFSCREFKRYQFDDDTMKLIIRLLEHVESDVALAGLLKDVHGIKVRRQTLGLWRMKYSPTYKPVHIKWVKTADGKLECIRCGLKATPEELKNCKIPPPYCFNPITQRKQCKDLTMGE